MGILTWLFGIRPNSPGVYRIRNRKNGKVYIGSTKRAIRLRLQEHVEDLHAGTHHNRLLQEDWDKCGPKAFAFEVIEHISDIPQIEARELYWQLRVPRDRSYMLQLAKPSRRRKFGYFMPSHIDYTSNMHPLDLLYALAWAVFNDGSFVFEPDKMSFLFKKGISEDDIRGTVARIREEPQPSMAPVTNEWVIKVLALQRNMQPIIPIPLP